MRPLISLNRSKFFSPSDPNRVACRIKGIEVRCAPL
jgi:hypothetical protein